MDSAQNSDSKSFLSSLKEKPKLAMLVFSVLALVFLISAVIFITTQQDAPNSDQSTTPQPTAQIQITNKGFVPASLVVKKGTKIIWTNTDKKTHQLQANPHPTGDSLPSLKSEILNNSQTYEYTADQPGTYNYHDHLTPTTNGTFEVQE